VIQDKWRRISRQETLGWKWGWEITTCKNCKCWVLKTKSQSTLKISCCFLLKGKVINSIKHLHLLLKSLNNLHLKWNLSTIQMIKQWNTNLQRAMIRKSKKLHQIGIVKIQPSINQSLRKNLRTLHSKQWHQTS
jgi:hypothetical protein